MCTKETHFENLHGLLAKSKFVELSNPDLSQLVFHNLEYLKTYKNVEGIQIVVKTLSELLDRIGIRLDLATTKGFIEEYYQMLTEYDTPPQAFDYVNRSYEGIFGEKKFKAFKDFETVVKKLPFRYNSTTMKLEELKA